MRSPRRTRLAHLALAVVLVLSCARMGAPPGGPPDVIAPKLLRTFPESVVVMQDFRGAVEFRFDKVIEEGGQNGQPNFGIGTGGLERLILLSPDTLVPRVTWHRDRITVMPRKGWKPNTVYRVELLPGLRDLHGNLDKSNVSITFATGGEKPTHYLSGRAIDWRGKRGAGAALIELTHLPERTTYRSIADSTGRFRVGPLPSGEYMVAAVIDVNQDRKREAKEPWDTVRIPASRDSIGEIWVFPRDTLPPKPTKTERQDSLSIAFEFEFPVDPSLQLPPDSIKLWALVGDRPDSQIIVTSGGFTQAAFDSLWKPVPAPRPSDSTAKPDTSVGGRGVGVPPPPPPPPAPVRPAARPVVDPPTEPRPALGQRFLVRSRVGLRPNVKYAIPVRGVRLLGGATGTVSGILPIMPVPNIDSIAKAKAKADSLKRADSVAKAAGGRGRGGGGLREFRWP